MNWLISVGLAILLLVFIVVFIIWGVALLDGQDWAWGILIILCIIFTIGMLATYIHSVLF